MKILAIADEADKRLWEHLDKSLLEGVDLIISCGDLPAEYLSFLTCFTHAPIYYVHGNHDVKYIDNPPEGCICIEDQLVVYNGLRILGLGGSMKYKKNTPCMYTERQMCNRINKLWFQLFRRHGFDILVTHAPAFELGDGTDLAHRGFKCFRKLMEKYKPAIMVHGHMHMSYSFNFVREREYQGTRILNVGPKVFFEIEPKK